MPRPSAEELLRELGTARLVVYIACAAGAGKTRRLLEDGRRMRDAGKRVAIGWVETKGRPDLEQIAALLPQIPARTVRTNGATYEDFDYEAAAREKPDVVILDELAHANLGDAPHAKRWQDALALRELGIGVIGAFNIQHLETIARTAESIIGYPVREIVPLSFLKGADEVIALDASPELLRRRLESGKIVREEDIERASSGLFREATLTMLRELMLRTIDSLTIPTLAPASASSAVAILPSGVDPEMFLSRAAPIASALDLLLEILPAPHADPAAIERLARTHHADVLPAAEPSRGSIDALRASLIALPKGDRARQLVSRRVARDVLVVDATQSYMSHASVTTPLSGTIGDRLRRGYGKLTVYLGAAAGCGKTYAMLDRGHQLRADGFDVVAGFVETHGRAETEAMIGDLEVVPRKSIVVDGMTYAEMDRDAVIARRPQVALVDELAHTNAPGSIAPKRYLDVVTLLRSGIDVVTTLNVQHLEALNDAVFRLTGTNVRETLPDTILSLAHEVILIDVSPETLRDRLRAGKIYPPSRIDAALSNFFRPDNLRALRELAIREALRAEMRERIDAPFARLLLSVVARTGDLALVRRAGRLAARLSVDFAICRIVEAGDREDPGVVDELRRLAALVRADFIDEAARDPAKRLLQLSREVPETTIAVGGTLRAPNPLQRKAFALRLLDAGARELIVFARRDAREEPDGPVADPP